MRTISAPELLVTGSTSTGFVAAAATPRSELVGAQPGRCGARGSLRRNLSSRSCRARRWPTMSG